MTEMPIIGSIVDGYRVTKVVARSAFAELYQCEQAWSGDKFLLKIARQEWLHEADSRAFSFERGYARRWEILPAEVLRREVILAVDLREMRVPVPLPIKNGQAEELFYSVFAFFDGISLDALINLGLTLRARTIVQILRAVQQLDEAGAFHGNLQPSAILVGPDSVLLMDTTLAVDEFDSPERNNLLRCVTNPLYYPFLDPRHDTLAVGILLYFLFTGVHPLAPYPVTNGSAPRRRAGPRLAGFIDQARLRGANRYLSGLLSFRNPCQVSPAVDPEIEDAILRTMGLWRTEDTEGTSIVEVIPETWLDKASADEPPDEIWTLEDTAKLLEARAS